MNIETINSYQRWATRGYVTALTCPYHVHLSLIPLVDSRGMQLVCPLTDYSQYLGLKDYRDIESKIKLAEFLFQQK